MGAHFEPLNHLAAADRTLFVFPHAGSGPSAYRWLSAALSDTQLYCLSLPGRGARLREPPLSQMEDVFASDLIAQIDELGGDEFAFFGHSLGGWIAHEAAQRLARCGARLPRSMHLSASRAPQVGYPKPHLHGMPAETLRNHISTLAQADGAEVPDKMIFELLEPAIRGDFQILEGHEVGQPIELSTELHCYIGARDTQVTSKDIAGWQVHTDRTLVTEVLPGGHFYFLGEASRQRLIGQLMQ